MITEWCRRATLAILEKPVQQQRLKLFELLIRDFEISREKICLDVGGITEGFESLNNLCVPIAINLEVRKKAKGWNLIVADARFLPIRAGSIDLTLSNALLEHVNEGRERLVREIGRVSKGNLFISVPSFFCLLEPHYHLPFFQFVPESVKKFLIMKMGLKLGYMDKATYSEIKLFRKSQLKQLFPQAQIYTLRMCLFSTNLVALKTIRPMLGSLDSQGFLISE